MLHLFRALILASATCSTAIRAAGNHLEALFGPHLSSGAEIAASSDADFDSVVGHRWSAWEVPDWSGAIKPATIRDIQEIVKIAGANNISFIPTNGGHGAKATLGQFTGIDVNMAGFNTVTVDAAHNLMKVAPGATLGDIMEATYYAGKEIQTGNSYCPGAIGVTLGGGIGMMTGMYGLMIDDLLSVCMITSQGEFVTASEWENPDLFWALRGAGNNFGIVTEATFRVHDQTNKGQMVEANYFYPAPANRSVWELLEKYNGDGLPVKMSLQAAVEYNRTANAGEIWLALWYFGNENEVKSHLDGFAALNPIAQNVRTMTQLDVYYQSVTRGVCNRGALINAYTLGMAGTHAAALEEHFADMMEFYEAHPGYNGQSYFQIYSNQEMRKTPTWWTAFAWRDVQTWWLFENFYSDPSLEPAIDEFSRDQREKLQTASGFSASHVYVNYANGDEGPAAWWSEEHLPWLRALKSRWDPTGMFGYGTPVQ